MLGLERQAPSSARLPTSEKAPRESPRARQEHNPPPKKGKVSRGLDKSLQLIRPSPIPRKWLAELFGQRASDAAIIAWRFGWRRPPQWAIDCVRSALQAKVIALQNEINSLRYDRKPSNHLNVWREREARKKEEARLADLQKRIDAGEII